MDRKTWNALVAAMTALGAMAFAVCLLHVFWFPLKSCEEMNRLYAPLMQLDCSKFP
jgi:hypothetical protein